jgi:hypothetical protein
MRGDMLSSAGLGARRALASCLAIGFGLVLILIGSVDLPYVKLPNYDTIGNPFTNWDVDSNCVAHYAKAFAWLNCCVAAAVPLLHLLARFLPSASSLGQGVSDQWLPAVLQRYGWSSRSLLVLAGVTAANALSFALPFAHTLEKNAPPYWETDLPEGARGVGRG